MEILRYNHSFIEIGGKTEVKYYHYLFNCPKCGSQYTLKELAKKK